MKYISLILLLSIIPSINASSSSCSTLPSPREKQGDELTAFSIEVQNNNTTNSFYFNVGAQNVRLQNQLTQAERNLKDLEDQQKFQIAHLQSKLLNEYNKHYQAKHLKHWVEPLVAMYYTTGIYLLSSKHIDDSYKSWIFSGLLVPMLCRIVVRSNNRFAEKNMIARQAMMMNIPEALLDRRLKKDDPLYKAIKREEKDEMASNEIPRTPIDE